MRLVRFEDGRLEFSPVEGASSDLASLLSKRLMDWTNRRWIVAISSDKGEATLREKAVVAKAEKLDDVRSHPLVKAALAAFPGAEIVDIRDVATDTVEHPTPMRVSKKGSTSRFSNATMINSITTKMEVTP